ncbi:MAG: hypothetical protein AVDCRST_MAG18-877, partial [uncultured Thermomicrobiales bacterium]
AGVAPIAMIFGSDVAGQQPMPCLPPTDELG